MRMEAPITCPKIERIAREGVAKFPAYAAL
jgi:hypothetical protein